MHGRQLACEKYVCVCVCVCVSVHAMCTRARVVQLNTQTVNMTNIIGSLTDAE